MSCDRRWVGLGSPDSRRCFHHQENVHGVEKGPPERGAEKQLDPHLQRQKQSVQLRPCEARARLTHEKHV